MKKIKKRGPRKYPGPPGNRMKFFPTGYFATKQRIAAARKMIEGR